MNDANKSYKFDVFIKIRSDEEKIWRVTCFHQVYDCVNEFGVILEFLFWDQETVGAIGFTSSPYFTFFHPEGVHSDLNFDKRVYGEQIEFSDFINARCIFRWVNMGLRYKSDEFKALINNQPTTKDFYNFLIEILNEQLKGLRK